MLLSLLTLSPAIFARPIDWHGSYGADNIVLSNFSKVKGNDATDPSNAGSQEFDLLTSDSSKNAIFQTYKFTLAPIILINDASTIKAEFSSGYASGGFLGDNSVNARARKMGHALYNYSLSGENKSLLVSKAYLELYSDTAIYLIGRHSASWGLGAILDAGESSWDRHQSIRDGITMKIKLGNFDISPFWGKIASPSTLMDSNHASEMGASILYDNSERDIAFGIYYSNRTSGNDQKSIMANANGTGAAALGKVDLKLTDIYFKKSFGAFEFQFEAPFVSGKIGKALGSTNANYNSLALLLQTNYQINQFWSSGLDAGSVNGHSGSTNTFQAMYLHPNFKIANILFNYNLRGIINSASDSIHDTYVTNVQYLRLKTKYDSEKWTWDSSFIYALAAQSASSGRSSYNHQKNKLFTATADQAKDYGFEFDSNFQYHWNSEVSIGGRFGYLVTGDYFAFTNSSASNETENVTLLEVNIICRF